MARVTIEDCTQYIPSRFELVILAAQRAKEIADGSPLAVKKDNDKNAVLALREIAAGHINADSLREALIKKFQKYQPNDAVDQPEEDLNEDQIEILREVKSFETKDYLEAMLEEEVDQIEEEEIE